MTYMFLFQFWSNIKVVYTILSRLTFLLSVARTFIVTCNILMKEMFGKIRNIHIKTFIKKLMDFEKQISNFMSLDRGLKKLVYKSKLKPSAGYLDPRRRVLDMRPDI